MEQISDLKFYEGNRLKLMHTNGYILLQTEDLKVLYTLKIRNKFLLPQQKHGIFWTGQKVNLTITPLMKQIYSGVDPGQRFRGRNNKIFKIVGL